MHENQNPNLKPADLKPADIDPKPAPAAILTGGCRWLPGGRLEVHEKTAAARVVVEDGAPATATARDPFGVRW